MAGMNEFDHHHQSSSPTTTVWHENLGDPTLADAILDQSLHPPTASELKPEEGPKSHRGEG
jgi:hypothetical protein